MMTVLLALLSLQTLSCLAEYDVISDLRRSVVDAGDYIETCKQEPLELGIVLDASSSIHILDFEKGKSFLQEFLKNFDISPREVRVSIITYGYGIYPQDGFNLTTYTNKNDVLAAIGRIPHKQGLRTDTGLAIQHMYEVQMSRNVVRPNVRKIAVVITDGDSRDKELTKVMAQKARDDNIVILAVGVGPKVNVQELINIGGNMSQVIQVTNYESLPSVLNLLKSRTCTRIMKTTTVPPKTACGVANPADIYFVFSPAGLGPDATSWATTFISSTIGSEELDVGFRYGVVAGSCPDDEGFDLDDYSTKEEYNRRLHSFTSNKLPQLLQRLKNDGYSSRRGGRAQAKKVAVIVTKDSKRNAELVSYVQELRRSGVVVYTANPSGNGVKIDGATPLSGSSASLQSAQLVNHFCN